MGSRSRARARAQANGTADPAGQASRPPERSRVALTVAGSAAVVAVEAVIMLIATVLAGIATASGKSYQTSSGIAITVLGAAAVAGLALVTAGLLRTRRWSRTPALLTQFFCGVIGVYLAQGSRLWWGVPLLALAVADIALLLAPPSLRALGARPPG